MKLIYDTDTDALYIDLREGRVEESEEVAPGFILDLDAEGNVLGIDIDSEASKKVDLSRLETDGLLLGLTPAEPRKPGRARAV
ncbi:MAG: DUF2283 domain-containing protein [Actinomycetota bacterium]|nr:DUF2283 domain-containing protein [Actinomycetota bacterium]HZY65843.1 DUF2283 domain-containing protein [Rubrobacteraceae bacterium]